MSFKAPCVSPAPSLSGMFESRGDSFTSRLDNFLNCDYYLCDYHIRVTISVAMIPSAQLDTAMMNTAFPSAFSAPTDSPGFMLYFVNNAWQARQRAALAPLDLTLVQFALLAGAVWLTRDESPLTQVRLARHAHLDVMMTSTVVRTLEQKRLLRRGVHPADSRAKTVQVTAAGRRLASEALGVVEAIDHAFFAALGPATAEFTAHLRHLVATAETSPATL